jgi:hypothetical protein
VNEDTDIAEASRSLRPLATGLAHEAIVSAGFSDPDNPAAFAARGHRRLLREEILGTIAEYLREATSG